VSPGFIPRDNGYCQRDQYNEDDYSDHPFLVFASRVSVLKKKAGAETSGVFLIAC
jgi:hypothetical protein